MKKIKSHLLTAIVAPTLLVFSMNASASLISVSESQNQTVDGQNFNFNLGTSDHDTGSLSILSVTVQGDFNSSSVENLAQIQIEGVNYGSYNINSAEAYNKIDYTSGVNNFNAWEFSVDFLLDSMTTALFLADNSLDVLVDFSNEVDVICGWSGTNNCQPNVGTSPFAAVNYTYNQVVTAVPEPSALLLLSLGLASFCFSRRKNAK